MDKVKDSGSCSQMKPSCKAPILSRLGNSEEPNARVIVHKGIWDSLIR